MQEFCIIAWTAYIIEVGKMQKGPVQKGPSGMYRFCAVLAYMLATTHVRACVSAHILEDEETVRHLRLPAPYWLGSSGFVRFHCKPEPAGVLAPIPNSALPVRGFFYTPNMTIQHQSVLPDVLRYRVATAVLRRFSTPTFCPSTEPFSHFTRVLARIPTHPSGPFFVPILR